MPSPFQRDFEEHGIPDLVEVLGQSMIYTPPDAEDEDDDVTFTGIFNEMDSEGIEIDGWGEKDDRRGMIEVAAATADGFALDGVFTIDEQEWDYCGESKRDAGLAFVKVSRTRTDRVDKFNRR